MGLSEKEKTRCTILKYKARLVAKGYSQKPGEDYFSTYAPVLDMVTFRVLLWIAIILKFDISAMDVVTAYLYGKIDTKVYMECPPGLHLLPGIYETFKNFKGKCLLLNKGLYGLKQSGRL